MINQNLENITQTGTSQTIDVAARDFDLTSAQFYTCLGCITLIIVLSLVMITRLVQTAILRMNYISPKVLQKLKEEILGELK